VTIATDPPHSKAALHALVIGVSAYPYAPRPGLASVFGPAISAARFAEFLRTEWRHPDWELGSLRVLLSPLEREEDTAREAAGEVHGRATRASVQDEVFTWAERRYQPDDAALLYVAGHGSDELLSSALLLLEDFGAPPRGLNDALDLSFVMRGMATRAAKANFFFLDACRNTIKEQQQQEGGPLALRPFVATGDPYRPIYKVIPGAAPHRAAWTLPDEQVHEHGTVFSKSLLSALRGGALDLDPAGQFGITMDHLLEATSTNIEREAAYLSAEYGADIRGSTQGIGTIGDVLFHSPGSVDVPLEIELHPAIAARFGEAELFKVEPGRTRFDRPVPLSPHPVRITVPSGVYRLHVKSRPPPPPTFNEMQDWIVRPATPYWKVPLNYE
jgi:hypothetical protein